jgi:hypothetical protein
MTDDLRAVPPCQDGTQGHDWQDSVAGCPDCGCHPAVYCPLCGTALDLARYDDPRGTP